MVSRIRDTLLNIRSSKGQLRRRATFRKIRKGLVGWIRDATMNIRASIGKLWRRATFRKIHSALITWIRDTNVRSSIRSTLT